MIRKRVGLEQKEAMTSRTSNGKHGDLLEVMLRTMVLDSVFLLDTREYTHVVSSIVS